MTVTAVSYVASCVSSACSNTLDVNSAVGIYTQYCATADQTSTFVFSSATQAATTSGGATSRILATDTFVSIVSSTITAANGQPSVTLITVTPSTGGNSGSQSTPSTTVNSSSSGSDNLESIIGEVIGGLFILGVIAAVITWLILREKRKKRPVDTAIPLALTAIGPNMPPLGGQPPAYQSGSLMSLPKLRSSRGTSVAAAFPVANPVNPRTS